MRWLPDALGHRRSENQAHAGGQRPRRDHRRNYQGWAGVTLVLRNLPILTAIIFDTFDWRISKLTILADSDYSSADSIDPYNAQRMILDDCLFMSSDDCSADRPPEPTSTLIRRSKNR